MLKRLFILILVLFMGYTVFQSTILPGWIEHIVKASFAEAGFEIKQLHIQFFSASMAEFKNITFVHANHVKIDSLKAHYSLRNLVKKHIDKIDFAGIEIQLDLNETTRTQYTRDVRCVERLLRNRAIPFDAVQIDLSRLLLFRDEARLNVPFSGSGKKEDGEFVFQIVSDVLGGTVDFSGGVTLAENELMMHAKLNALDPGLFPEELLPSNVRIPLHGMIQGTVTTKLTDAVKNIRLDLSFRLAGVLRNIPFEMNQARLTSDYQTTGSHHQLRAAASIEQVELLGYDVKHVGMTASNHADGIHVAFKGSGQHLSFEQCDIYLDGAPNLLSMLCNYQQLLGTVLQARLKVSHLRATALGFSIAADTLAASSYIKTHPHAFRLNDIQLLVKNASLSQGPLQCNGINGTWTVSEIAPLSTPNGQLITVESATWNNFDFTDGRILFGIENPSSIFVERSDWNFCDGRVSCRPFRFNPHDHTINVNAFFEELQLNPVMNTLMPGIIEGEGHLYGRVPLHFRWRTPLMLNFRSGYLYTIPSTGNLRVLAPEKIPNVYLSEKSALSMENDMQPSIYESLADFEYSLFKIDFENADTTGTDGTIHIRGKGAKADGLPLGLSVRFNLKH